MIKKRTDFHDIEKKYIYKFDRQNCSKTQKKRHIENTCTKPRIKRHCVSYIMLVHEYRTYRIMLEIYHRVFNHTCTHVNVCHIILIKSHQLGTKWSYTLEIPIINAGM